MSNVTMKYKVLYCLVEVGGDPREVKLLQYLVHEDGTTFEFYAGAASLRTMIHNENAYVEDYSTAMSMLRAFRTGVMGDQISSEREIVDWGVYDEITTASFINHIKCHPIRRYAEKSVQDALEKYITEHH